MIHARDPEGERGRRRDLRHARRPGRRAAGDPALLLGPAAGRRRGRARLVLLVRRQRHLPEAPRRCARRRRRCPRTGSWSRPTLPTWRRSRCAASATSPPTWSPPRAGRRRGARRLLRGAGADGRGQRARALRLVARAVVRLGQNFLADPNLLDAIVRDAGLGAGRRRARGRGGGRGADRAPGRGRRPRAHGRDRPRPGAGAGAGRRPAQRRAALGRRDEARPGRAASRRRRRWSPTCPTRWRRR